MQKLEEPLFSHPPTNYSNEGIPLGKYSPTETVEEEMDADLVPVSDGCCSFSVRASNLIYGSIMAGCAMAAILFKYIDPSRIFHNWFSFDICTSTVCFGNQAVYRFSFALVAFFGINLLICLCSPQFHTTSWSTKASLLSTFLTLSFLVPAEVYIVYREISRYFSFFYLLIQVLILINLVYTIHAYILNKMDSGEGDEKTFRLVYIAIFVAATLAGIVGVSLLYHYSGNCSLHNGVISTVLILGVATIFASATAAINKGTLTPALLFAYCTFLCYQALHANPNAECNPYAATETPLWQILLMFMFNSLAIGWNTSRTAQSVHALFHVEQVRAAVADDSEDEEGGKPKRVMTRRQNVEMMSKRGVLYFHASMALAGLYFAMMLTGWGAEGTKKMNITDASEQSFWVKVVNIWATYALYIWTLVAPFVCPDRDFS